MRFFVTVLGVGLAGGALAASAAELGEIPRVNDLRVGLGLIGAPKVTENITRDGVTAGYTWSGGNNYEPRFGITYVADSGIGFRHGPRFLTGIGLDVASGDLAPERYGVGGRSYSSSIDGQGLRHRTALFSVLAGYGSTVVDSWLGEAHVEVLPRLGIGATSVETQGFDSDGSSKKKSGHALCYEYGVQGGIYTSGSSMVLGLTVGYLLGSSSVSIPFPGSSNKVTLEQHAVLAQVSLGGRF